MDAATEITTKKRVLPGVPLKRLVSTYWRCKMFDPNWVFENHTEAAKIIDALREAIKPFAEEPSKYMDSFPCHNGITTKEKCGRCSRAIAAYNALNMCMNG